jgi:hypothetical protein
VIVVASLALVALIALVAALVAISRAHRRDLCALIVMWNEERRSLLDRVQDPYAVVAARMPQVSASSPESDEKADEEWAARAESLVTIPPDLALYVSDEEVAG